MAYDTSCDLQKHFGARVEYTSVLWCSKNTLGLLRIAFLDTTNTLGLLRDTARVASRAAGEAFRGPRKAMRKNFGGKSSASTSDLCRFALGAFLDVKNTLGLLKNAFLSTKNTLGFLRLCARRAPRAAGEAFEGPRRAMRKNSGGKGSASISDLCRFALGAFRDVKKTLRGP